LGVMAQRGRIQSQKLQARIHVGLILPLELAGGAT
jgi:hypothetical protein